MKKVKILLLMPEVYHGGAEVQFRHVIERINKSKFDITVVIEQSCECRDDELADRFIDAQKDVHFIKLKGLRNVSSKLRRYWSFISLNIQLIPIMKKIQPDIVLCYAELGLKSMYLVRKMGAIPVYSERNAGNDDRKYYKRNELFFESTGAILCNSFAAQRVMNKYGINATCIPNGIIETDILPIVNKDHYEILVPARIAKVKNQEVVIKAISFLKKNDIRVSFVGKTEDLEYLKYLKKLGQELGVEDKLCFVPYTNDIADYYKKANLVILPSFSEGLSNVILESYMYGRICLLSDIPMNRDIGNCNQQYFSPENPKELADLIKMSILADDKNIQISSNWEYVVKTFGIKKMISTYESLFMDLAHRTDNC